MSAVTGFILFGGIPIGIGLAAFGLAWAIWLLTKEAE